MSYKSHYGKGMDQADSDMVLPGSPDARRSAYSRDQFDSMSTRYGKKVSTKKNKTGTAAPNTGIQGSADSQTQDKSTSVSGTGKTHKKHYGTKMGSQLDNSVGAYDEYDYGKGRNKKGDQRKRVKSQGR